MIDWNRVNDLRNEVGPEDFAEVVEIFLEEVEEVVQRLKTAPNRDKLGDDLHFLKGSSLNLGFAAFSSLCEQGELAAEKGQADTIDLGSILSAFTESKTVFLANPEIA